MVATGFFEGSEKKLEIILMSPDPELRINDDGRWNRIVEACGAKIISRISSRRLDAYLLSESSLFVWDDRILMVTCGQTALIQSYISLMDLLGKRQLAFLFYERKNMRHPAKQRSSFEDDLRVIKRHLEGQHFRLGSHSKDYVDVFYTALVQKRTPHDATFQILMHGLAPDVARNFCSGHGQAGNPDAFLGGLRGLYPEMAVDDHVFAPYGYSLNGIKDSHYFAVHVTPQPGASYASFETNVIEADYTGIVQAVTGLFTPQRFTIVLTSNMNGNHQDLLGKVSRAVKNYCIAEASHFELEGGYASFFINCEKSV
jgi:S-adenosylmethionine decarboxylase